MSLDPISGKLSGTLHICLGVNLICHADMAGLLTKLYKQGSDGSLPIVQTACYIRQWPDVYKGPRMRCPALAIRDLSNAC